MTNGKRWQTCAIAISLGFVYSTFTLAFAQHPVAEKDSESMAILSTRNGRYKEALKYASKAIAKSPDRFDLYLNRSSTYLNLKDYKNALADLNKAEVLMKGKEVEATERSQLHFNRGSVYLEMKRDQEALKDMQLAVKAFPFHAGAEYELGRLYTKMGKKDLALKALKSSRELYVMSKSRPAIIALLDKEIAKANALK